MRRNFVVVYYMIIYHDQFFTIYIILFIIIHIYVMCVISVAAYDQTH